MNIKKYMIDNLKNTKYILMILKMNMKMKFDFGKEIIIFQKVERIILID